MLMLLHIHVEPVSADWVLMGLSQNSARNAQGKNSEVHSEMLSGCACAKLVRTCVEPISTAVAKIGSES